MSFSYTQIDNPTGVGPFTFTPTYSDASDIVAKGFSGKYWSNLAIASVDGQTVTFSESTDGLQAIRISNNAHKFNDAVGRGSAGNVVDKGDVVHEELRLHIEDPKDPTGISTMTAESITLGGINSGVKDAIQGYYAFVTNFYDPNTTNTVQELDAATWTDVNPDVYLTFDKRPTSMVEAAPVAYDYDGTKHFSLAGLDEGSFVTVRLLFRVDPEVDESSADVRLHFNTNAATAAGGLDHFHIETQALTMTQGADIFYSDENLITFFVGDTLSGDTVADAGSFHVQVKSSVEADVEVLGVTMYISK